MTFRTMVLLSIPALVLAGCGSSAVSPDAGGCTEGATEACTCTTGGSSGEKTCASDGVFGACVCNTDGGAGGTGGGTAGGTGGGSGGGSGGGTAGGTGGGSGGGSGGGTAGGTGGGSGGGSGGGTAGGTGGGSGGGSAGTPTASFSTATIDFSLADCGGAAPATKTLSIGNTGTAPLTYSTSLTSAAEFAITGNGSGTVAAGQSANITIAAGAIATTATAATAISTDLTLTTNDTAHAQTSIMITITPHGGVLTVAPPNTAFGTTAVDTAAADIPIAITNSGNAAVTVAFGASSNTDFGVTYTGADAGVSVAAAGGTLAGLEGTFTPTVNTTENATIPLIVTGPVCANSATQLTESGSGTNGVFGISTSDVEFGPNSDGFVPCNTKATAKTITFSNTGNAAYDWSASLGAGVNSNFSISQSSGTVGIGLTPSITITPLNTIPQTSATTTDLYSDTLTITTDAANDTAHVINLHQTAQGAILSISPTDNEFGSIPVNTTSTAPFNITNSGNSTANVALTLSDTTDFSVTPGAGPTAVTSGSSLTATVTFMPPSTPATYNATLSVGSTDVLCAPLPTPATMSGTGLAGTVAFSPSSLAFGQINCGSTPGAKSITFSNAGNSPYSITTSLQRGNASPYTLTTTCSGGGSTVVAANGGTCAISVQPEAIPQTSAVTQNLYGDLLTVTTNAPNDQPHYIPFTLTAQGAIFSFESTSINFGAVPAGAGENYNWGITNEGNVNATLQMTVPSGQGFAVQNVNVARVNSEEGEIQFRPSTAATAYVATATLALQTGDGVTLCQALPSTTLTLAGSGTAANNVLVTPASVDFKYLPCGGTGTGNAQGVNVENNTALPITFTAALGKTGSNALYTISPTGTQTLAAGTGTKITVTPLAVGATSSTQFHGLLDTLTITTNAAGDSPHYVYLQKTAQGAVIVNGRTSVTLPPTAMGVATSIGGGFQYRNVGNQNLASVAYTISGDTTDFSVSPSTLNMNAGDSQQATAKFDPATAGEGAKTATVTLTAPASGLCAPLPTTPVTLSGTGQ